MDDVKCAGGVAAFHVRPFRTASLGRCRALKEVREPCGDLGKGIQQWGQPVPRPELVCLGRKEAEKAEVQCSERWGWRRQKSGRSTLGRTGQQGRGSGRRGTGSGRVLPRNCQPSEGSGEGQAKRPGTSGEATWSALMGTER